MLVKVFAISSSSRCRLKREVSMRPRKSSRAARSRRLKRRGKGSHSKARRPSLMRLRTRGGMEASSSPTGPVTSTSRSAAGSPSTAGAIAAQIALRVRCSAADSPGARCQPGAAGRPTRPASDHSQSAVSARRPSTRKFSR